MLTYIHPKAISQKVLMNLVCNGFEDCSFEIITTYLRSISQVSCSYENMSQRMTQPHRTRAVFCLLLGVSSDYAQLIPGQVTEVTWLWLAKQSLSLLWARDRKQALIIAKKNPHRNFVLLVIIHKVHAHGSTNDCTQYESNMWNTVAWRVIMSMVG